MIQAPRGTFDVLPEEAARREAARGAAPGGSSAPPATGGSRRPTFEATELFARGVGEATDIVQKEMYTFDDGGGRSLTLRPEGTAPVCRAYIEHGMHKLPQPVKLWYLSSFFRAEAPQRGRYRQFWQVGAEAIGSAGPETDAELIVLLAELLHALGVKGPPADAGQPRLARDARRLPRGADGSICARTRSSCPHEVRGRIDLNPLRAFDATDPATREIMQGAPKLLDRLTAEDAEHFAEVRALLDDAGIAYELDPTLVRGLDYYTRTLFEFSSDALGAQSGVGGGGRYDRLIEQLDGPPTPGCGWAAGVERMLLAAGELPVPAELVDLFVALAERRRGSRTAFELARERPPRRAGGPARAGRAVAEGPAQARRPDRGALRGDRRRGRRRR